MNLVAPGASNTPLSWPADARIAVMITVMFESWPEGKAPPYSPMASPLREGTIDRQGFAWAEYGGRAGIWRLLQIFERFGVKVTVAANAKSLERHPEAARAIVEHGHEVAGHGYTQDQFMVYLEREEERALIERCSAIIEHTTGKRPVGWASPRMTASLNTADLLAQAGFRWHGDVHDADLPVRIVTAAGDLVGLPHSEFTDNRVMRGSPRDFQSVYTDTFDFLYRHEAPALLNLTVHAHWGGRPPMAAVLSNVLDHLSRAPGVWFARHDEVADWVTAQGSLPAARTPTPA